MQLTLYGLNRLCLGVYMYIQIQICIAETTDEKRGHGCEGEAGEVYRRPWERKEKV